MKYILCVVAVASLLAPVAFGQTGTQRDFVERAPRALPGDARKTEIVLILGSGDAPEFSALVGAIRKEMTRSRQLEPIVVDDSYKAKLWAPLALEQDAASGRMTVRFGVTTARGLRREDEVSCAVSKPNDCARAIVVYVEKYQRDFRTR